MAEPTGDPAPLPRGALPVERVLPLGLLVAGGALAGVAVATHAAAARSAASQNWPPFVLVGGLLLIGLVAQEDGLFAAAGRRLARTAHSPVVLYLGASLLIAVVTATLNLDTSVAFLTPVLVYTARSRGEPEAPLLFACILLANASSLFLPGSNLTNLIVLGHLHIDGGQYFSHMWLPATTALLVTIAVIGFSNRAQLHTTTLASVPAERPVVGLGLIAVVAATVIVLVVPAPAIPVACVGVGVVATRVVRRRETIHRCLEVLGLPILLGLLGLAVALGTLGRVWDGPAGLLAHLDGYGTAAVAAVSTVLFNNLPAASLLAARTPPQPFPLLIGLNLGPNLFVTGSLAWVLWLRAGRAAGASPSVRAATRIGVVAVPLSIVAAVGVLLLAG